MEYIQINISKLKKEITLSNFFKTTRGTERAVIIERKKKTDSWSTCRILFISGFLLFQS